MISARRDVVAEQRRRWRATAAGAAASRCAWLASATTASSAVSAIPLSSEPASAAHDGTLDEHGERVALGLEDRLLDVAEILAVGLQRQRPVAAISIRSRSWP